PPSSPPPSTRCARRCRPSSAPAWTPSSGGPSTAAAPGRRPSTTPAAAPPARWWARRRRKQGRRARRSTRTGGSAGWGARGWLARRAGVLSLASGPASPEKLSKQIEKHLAERTPEGDDKAYKLVKEYLDAYGDRRDDMTKKVVAWKKEIEQRECDRL